MLNTIHFFRIKLCRLYLEIYSEFSFAAQNDTGSHFSSLLRQKRQNPTSPNKELTLRVQPFQFRSQTPLQKGMPAEGTILQPVPDKLLGGGSGFSPFSQGRP